jgi:hypothetical protein
MPARLASFDHACSSGPSLVGEPRSETTSTASTNSGAGSAPTSSLAPTSPRFDPSTDASTSVFSDGRPWKTRASCMSAAVSAALPGASGVVAASRAATITI